MSENLNICLVNDSFPPEIDGVANAVTNYADIITRCHGKATVVTPANSRLGIFAMSNTNALFPCCAIPAWT